MNLIGVHLTGWYDNMTPFRIMFCIKNAKDPALMHRAFCINVHGVPFLGTGRQSFLIADTERLLVQFDKCLRNT